MTPQLPARQSNITRGCHEIHGVCNGDLVGHADFLRKVPRPIRQAARRNFSSTRTPSTPNRRSRRSVDTPSRLPFRIAVTRGRDVCASLASAA
jgi:hypothetical protein